MCLFLLISGVQARFQLVQGLVYKLAEQRFQLVSKKLTGFVPQHSTNLWCNILRNLFTLLGVVDNISRNLRQRPLHDTLQRFLNCLADFVANNIRSLVQFLVHILGQFWKLLIYEAFHLFLDYLHELRPCKLSKVINRFVQPFHTCRRCPLHHHLQKTLHLLDDGLDLGCKVIQSTARLRRVYKRHILETVCCRSCVGGQVTCKLKCLWLCRLPCMKGALCVGVLLVLCRLATRQMQQQLLRSLRRKHLCSFHRITELLPVQMLPHISHCEALGPCWHCRKHVHVHHGQYLFPTRQCSNGY
mmetsp:Transcript_126172/g.252023  ORF Transcript_126172/g.252023 Transcript_126172/m.252023 type:complete len:301 (-) Transcript_126172:1522-2424(-)